MPYSPVIGLEIHVELNTKTKMFCGCSADYWGAPPDTHTCPVCLGLPGALPYVNKGALEKCIMLGLALNCKVSSESRFERKNYFYPDLPKGYQISQYRWPLCKGGLWVMGNGKKIGINRVHQEEDTGKLSHIGGVTHIDFNRSGVPLVEIVTEPDFETAEQAVEFAKSIWQMVRDLGVSNSDMERGNLRLEANVSLSSVQRIGNSVQELPNYRVELKNINSFRFMQHAIEHEIKRQSEALDRGEVLIQETRGWDEDKGESVLQRSKEEAHDYRYFPEPDLPVLSFSEQDIQKIKAKIPKLSGQLIAELVEKYGIAENMVRTLSSQGKMDYFEEVMNADHELSPLNVANMIVNKKIDTDLKVIEFIGKLREIKGGEKTSEEDLEIAVLSVMEHNEGAVESIKKGKSGALEFLVGLVMKETKGAADAQRTRELLKQKLDNI